MRALSLILIAAGAILAFAVNVWVDGVDLVAIGVILMVVGGIGLVASFFTGSARTSHTRQVSDDGRTVVDETTTHPM